MTQRPKEEPHTEAPPRWAVLGPILVAVVFSAVFMLARRDGARPLPVPVLAGISSVQDASAKPPPGVSDAGPIRCESEDAAAIWLRWPRIPVDQIYSQAQLDDAAVSGPYDKQGNGIKVENRGFLASLTDGGQEFELASRGPYGRYWILLVKKGYGPPKALKLTLTAFDAISGRLFDERVLHLPPSALPIPKPDIVATKADPSVLAEAGRWESGRESVLYLEVKPTRVSTRYVRIRVLR
ncbi:MAG TPA: hypothetical protein VMI31_19215, partial [Fimbriimonadaceae bacterium]|nr:hypothetical protein [Fimbriimonadaceae bacterium]